MEFMNDINNNKFNSSSASINAIKITSLQHQQNSSISGSQILKAQSIIALNHEDDSGIEQDSTILIRVCINEQNLQV